MCQAKDLKNSIPCKDCEYVNIGQTKCEFGTRLKEHQNELSFSKKKNSALPREHAC